MSDDEWEYEYDPVLTEDIYIPLDLSNVAPRQTQNQSQRHKTTDSERRTGHPTLLKSRLRALNAQRAQDASATATTSGKGLGAESAEAQPRSQGEIRVLGLHTENPLVEWNGQVLSVQWAATIGTDLFFARPGDEQEQEQGNGREKGEPLRRLPGVDLLGLSAAKLVARVARLRPRDEVLDSVAAVAGGEARAVGGEDEQEGVASAPTTGFLARLNAVKARKGEATRLAVDRSGGGARLVGEDVGAAVRESDVEMGGT